LKVRNKQKGLQGTGVALKGTGAAGCGGGGNGLDDSLGISALLACYERA